MKRAGTVALVLVAIAAAFLLGRWSNRPPADSAMARQVDAAWAAAADRAGDAATTAADRARFRSPAPAPVPSANAPTPVGSDGRPRLPDIPVSARAPGPQPLRPEDQAPLDKAERAMAADGGTSSDLLDLARDEPQDDQARQLEAMLSQAIMRNGGRYTDLRLSPPHCTRSVCLLRGIGEGFKPSSDWQRLSGTIASEPWFREAFDDMRVMVGSSGSDTVYITLYVRCAAGQCLHAGGR